ncbi:MAG: hypothetical protein ABW189_01355, partial [Rickettsiales bacterium]
MTNVPVIEVKIENCFKEFIESYNRVKYFCCVADNLEASFFPSDWLIKNEGKLDFGVKALSEEEQIFLLTGFRFFLRRYLLRDAVESFAISLENLFF